MTRGFVSSLSHKVIADRNAAAITMCSGLQYCRQVCEVWAGVNVTTRRRLYSPEASV